jgi:hypothetical protein
VEQHDAPEPTVACQLQDIYAFHHSTAVPIDDVPARMIGLIPRAAAAVALVVPPY